MSSMTGDLLRVCGPGPYRLHAERRQVLDNFAGTGRVSYWIFRGCYRLRVGGRARRRDEVQ